jgi:anti-anti-sigma factor
MGGPFEVREAVDLDGALRLTLLGGLDIVVAERLTARLQTLRAEGRTVRIDLSELEFIDCTGLKAIIDELAASRNIGRILEVDRPVSAPVKRVITFMDVSSMLWPADGDGQRPALRVIDGSADRESDDSPRSREATGPPALGPPLEESADVRPGTPGASVTSDR